MNTALQLAPRLAVSRLRNSKGGAILDVLTVVSFAISTLLALTIAGGTWMLWNRAPQALDTADSMGWTAALESQLAFVACALLVVPILSLGGAAARLGARGRSRRLASLRLLGMTSVDVITMSVVETLVQAVVGAVLGLILYPISLPIWTFVSFQGKPIQVGEMMLPIWITALVLVTVILLALLSTIIGLQRVRISPLGVARQETPASLKAWRAIIIVVALVAFMVVVPNLTGFSDRFFPYLVIGGFFVVLIGAVNLVGPFILQTLARPFARTNNAARLIAARRIIDDPRAAWRNVGAVALVSVSAAFVTIAPIEFLRSEDLSDPATYASLIGFIDIRTGVMITLAVGLILAAVSALVMQASSMFDRADESIALDRMGVPRTLFSKERRYQVLMPLVIALVGGMAIGMMLTVPFYSIDVAMGLDMDGIIGMGIVAISGILLTFAGAEACRPLQSGVLREQRRRND